MKGRVPLKVRVACREWVIKIKLPTNQYPTLIEMATKSYKNLSLSERDSWTLEQVVKQGL